MDSSIKMIKEHINVSSNKVFTMHQAKPEDTKEVSAILVETAQWLLNRGSSQWSGLLTGEDSHNTADAVLNGDVFICKSNTDIAGMVILLRQPSAWDVKLWEEEAFNQDGSLYLHRLAISRKYANLGLGASILEWCESGIRFVGKSRIRLDCIADNSTLNQFYSQHGYTYRGEQAGWSIYEKSLSDQ